MSKPVSSAQLAANQANAQLSTGPKTDEGKAKSSVNAVKTGLTGRTVVLPTEDVAAYRAHVKSFFTGWDPQTDDERTLVQAIADIEWRLLRIPSLEAGIYALGRLEFAAEFASEDAAARQSLIQAKTFMVHRRDLNNLSLQETRLRLQRDRDSEKLTELQENRRRERAANLTSAADLYERCQEEDGGKFDREEFLEELNYDLGFEFSLDDIDARLQERACRRNRQPYYPINRNPVSKASGYRRAA